MDKIEKSIIATGAIVIVLIVFAAISSIKEENEHRELEKERLLLSIEVLKHQIDGYKDNGE